MRHAFPIGASVTLDQLAADPHPVLALLRQREPVSWLPAIGGWLVTGRDAAIAAMRDAATFTVDDPRFSTAQVIGPSMLSLDGAEHDRHRRPFVDPFRGADVRRRFGDWVEARARELVAAVAPEGEAELRTRVAAPLAVEVVAAALGVEAGDPFEVLGWYEAIVASVDRVTAGEPVDDAGRAAFAALSDAVEAATAAPGTLLADVAGTGTLTTREVVSNAAVLLFGGIVTSEGTNALALYDLAANPDQLARVHADRSLVATAVEESMRLEPAAAVVDRYATRDCVLAGARIARSDLVRISLAAPNRDPAVFPNPDRYDAGRPNAHQHLTFARGPHACLGIHLARLEARALVGATLDLLPGLRLDDDRSTPPAGLIFRRPEQVWATFPPS